MIRAGIAWCAAFGDRLPFDFATETDLAVLSTLRTAAAGIYDVVII